jgi:hypothetical protein
MIQHVYPRIPDPDFFIPDPDPGAKKALDPGSATLINTILLLNWIMVLNN